MYVMACALDSYVQVRGVSGQLEESHPRHGTDRVLLSNFYDIYRGVILIPVVRTTELL